MHIKAQSVIPASIAIQYLSPVVVQEKKLNKFKIAVIDCDDCGSHVGASQHGKDEFGPIYLCPKCKRTTTSISSSRK